MQVLTAQQKQTSLTTLQWLRDFQSIKKPKEVLLDKYVSKLVIESSNSAEDSLDTFKGARFRSDAVKEIRTIFNSDKRQVKPQLLTLLSQNLYPNQERLARWMLDLLTASFFKEALPSA